MIKFAKFAAAAVLATAATAAYADETGSFRLDGRTYTYTSTTTADGALRLRGTATPGGDFDYVVKNGVVEGTTAGSPVSFRAADAKGAARRATSVQVAAKASTVRSAD